MIIYVYNEEYYSKTILPIRIAGVYQIYGKNQQFLANIEEENNRWVIKPAQNMVLEGSNSSKLNIYDEFIIKELNTDIRHYIYVSPVYEQDSMKYYTQKETITIGNLTNNDIKYIKPNLPQGEIKLTNSNGFWILDTNLPNVFVMDERVNNRIFIYNGDYIFYNGLRIIILGNFFIINNPNNLVNINPQSLILQENSSVKNEIITSKIAENTPLYSKDDYYFKSPRFEQVIEEENVIIDEPPTPENPETTPLILTIGPQMTMICTSGISIASTINTFMSGQGYQNKTRLILSISTMCITMVGAFLWPTITRYYNKKRIKKRENLRQQKYKNYLLEKQQEIKNIKQKQKQILIDNATTIDKCRQAIEQRTRILWQRNIEHDDFLQVRLGTGNAETKINIDIPQEKFTIEETDKMFTELQTIVNESLTIENVPQNINLTEEYITGIVGPDDLTKSFIDSLFFQIMTLHSYTELKIIVYTNSKKKWDYLKILPHCWDNQKTIRYFATNTEELNEIIQDLDKTFDNRVKEDESVQLENDGSEEYDKKLYKKYRPYYLIFTDDISSIRNVSLIKKILKYKQNVGFSILMLNDRLSTLPSETTSFVIVDRKESGLIKNELSKDNQKRFIADYIGNVDIYNYAQALANIPISVEKSKYELPSSLSFLEMYEVGKVEQLNSSERWKNNNPSNNLSVPIGIDQNGEIFKMDIHEKAYGPHGLVAGTTGSGKSEWIITYILSLAINYHPDEVQFVLIDYKGGGLAMSFENEQLGIKLPHLAGTITNLDKSEINRSIASMESELKRRQSIFNEAREKLKEGSMNIYKYQQFYRKGQVDKSMSHLIIICDEFAELKQQQPEFMEQLISISRIGRSLGVHLILATQKPSGVVNEQIWSNSKFKVCLKVQDKSDSNEILKKPDAAFLKQTGAFYLEVGNDDYYNLGQSAWAGAKYYPSEVLQKKIDQSVQYINNIGKVVNYFDEESEIDTQKECKGEELINIIQYIDEISKKETIEARQLWLPNVPEISYLKDLITKYNHKYEPLKYNIAIGEYDEPRKQEQGLLEIDISEGNIAIIGQVGSGKESLISTTIWSSIIEHTPHELNYYILDMGAETLKKFSKFPHVGEVVTQEEVDRIVGVLELVLEEQKRRKDLFVDYNGSFEYYNKVSKEKLPLIVLIINSIEVFEETQPKLAEFLNTMYREGPKYGIIFIVSASSQNALRQRQLQYFNHIIMMQMQDENAYRNITNCRRGLLPSKKFGRGICKTSEDTDSYCEFQTAKIIEDEKLIEYLNKMSVKMREHYKYKAKELAKIPDNITSEELVNHISTLNNVPIGYDFYEKTITKYDFSNEKIYLVSGNNIKENMKFIYGLTSVLSKISNVKIRVVDMLGIFKKPILDIKIFNEKIDEVFAAIERDVFTRTEMQDNGINIIIGAGQYKKKLSPGGVEIFDNIFNNLPRSKKNTFILIDDYDKLRTLKLEKWYSQVNNTKGIWLGQELNNQSLINVNNVSTEDKKFNFEGVAFTIDESKYKLIKTVLDGDE